MKSSATLAVVLLCGVLVVSVALAGDVKEPARLETTALELGNWLHGDPYFVDNSATSIVRWSPKDRAILLNMYGGRKSAEDAKDSITMNLLPAIDRFNQDLSNRRGFKLALDDVVITYATRGGAVQVIHKKGAWVLP